MTQQQPIAGPNAQAVCEIMQRLYPEQFARCAAEAMVVELMNHVRVLQADLDEARGEGPVDPNGLDGDIPGMPPRVA